MISYWNSLTPILIRLSLRQVHYYGNHNSLSVGCQHNKRITPSSPLGLCNWSFGMTMRYDVVSELSAKSWLGQWHQDRDIWDGKVSCKSIKFDPQLIVSYGLKHTWRKPGRCQVACGQFSSVTPGNSLVYISDPWMAFLCWHSALQGPSTGQMICFWNYRESRTPSTVPR